MHHGTLNDKATVLDSRSWKGFSIYSEAKSGTMLWLFSSVLFFFHASEVTLVVLFNRPELNWSCTFPDADNHQRPVLAKVTN